MALALTVLAVYAQTGSFEFVNFDDGLYVAANPRVQQGLSWSGIAWAFSAWNFIYWHPLTFLSHMLDVTVFGLDPGWHHLVNAALHAANGALLFLLLFRMTGAKWPSAAAAALFALHPMRVESVAWVAERKDVLSGLFFLLTLWTYHAWTQRRAPHWSWLVCGVLGLMAKPMLVTMPFVLLLIDRWPLARTDTFVRRVVEKAPLFALSFGIAALTYAGQEAYGARAELAQAGLSVRLANAAVSYVHYLGKTFWPEPLAVFYPYRLRIPASETALCLALLACLSALCWWMGKRRPYLLTGWLWFAGMLVPTIGFVQVGAQSMADRFAYLPSIGLAITLVWLAAERPSRATVAAAVAVLGACTIVSWRQAGYWRDSVTLFSHAVEVTADNSLARHNLGFALANRGEHAAAVPQFREAVRLEPRYFQGYYNLGRSLDALGNKAEALGEFERAITVKSDYAEARFARATILQQLGRVAEAEPAWRTALGMPLDAGFAADGHNSLGILLGQKGDYAGAMVEFEKALALRPDLEAARRNLAAARQLLTRR